MHLLDTDTCIAILRGVPAVIERRARTDDEVTTTWVTAAELYYGAAKSNQPSQHKHLVDAFLATLPIIGTDQMSAQLFGILKADLESQGTRLADADLWIGAIARVRGAVLVTGNQRHLGRIPGLRIEDWLRG